MTGSGLVDDVGIGSLVGSGAYEGQPHFSITRREAALTVIVCANTRWTLRSVKPMLIRALDPSVAYP